MEQPATGSNQITCAGCGTQRGRLSNRLPNGWKRQNSADVFCRDCWRRRYLLRAITMPVASPLDCSWEELRAAIKPMWAATTAASNWMMTELYARDVRRNGQEKMPPMGRVYLYPEARQRFPALPSTTVASLEQACQRKYRAARYETVWTCARSLSIFRYPTPFPLHDQSWHPTLDEDKPTVSLRIGDARMRLRLKSGPQFRRQYGQFRQLARGEAVKGELAIYERGDALLVKMVAWMPRPATVGGREGTLLARTSSDCLLCALNARDETLWRYNGDHLVRWAAAHRRQLGRWAEDQKYENRPTPAFADRRSAAVRKFSDRMASATHEIAAQLAGYASRRKFEAVRYEDANKSYCEQFPWFRLRALLGEKLDAAGIRFEASGDVPAETGEPLAGE